MLAVLLLLWPLNSTLGQQPNRFGRPDAESGTIAGKIVDVSGSPAIGARVRIRGSFADIDATTVTDASGGFEFAVQINKEGLPNLTIFADTADGSQAACGQPLVSDRDTTLKPLDIQLEQTSEARFTVSDTAGTAVPKARVAVQLTYPLTIGPVETDGKGKASIRIPRSESISSIVVWKDHEGLDYKVYELPREQAGEFLAKKPVFPFEGGENFTLQGASPLRVRIADTSGQPLKNALASVWFLRKSPGETSLSLSDFGNKFQATTDAAGIVPFDWFPVWQQDTSYPILRIPSVGCVRFKRPR